VQLELEDYKNKLRQIKEKSEDLSKHLEDREEEAKRLKQELDSLRSQRTADEEKNRVAVKSATDELTQANLAYNEMKQQFLFEVENLKQGMEEVSTELELRSQEADRYRLEVSELREKAKLDTEKSRQNMGELMEADKEKERKLAERESEIRELKVNMEEVNEKLMEVNCCLKAARTEASETKKVMESGRNEADRLRSQLKEAVEKLNSKIEECNSIDGKFLCAVLSNFYKTCV
jgi:chromosome segregation ATPase